MTNCKITGFLIPLYQWLPRTSHCHWFTDTINIKWQRQILKLPTMYLYFFIINHKQPTHYDYLLFANSWIILKLEHKAQSFQKFPQYIEIVCCLFAILSTDVLYNFSQLLEYTAWTFYTSNMYALPTVLIEVFFFVEGFHWCGSLNSAVRQVMP
jgi:uncharacterized membrane protein YhdT